MMEGKRNRKVIVLLIILGGIFYLITPKIINNNLNWLKENKNLPQLKQSSEKKIKKDEFKEKLPSQYLISNVPFSPQAPYGFWDELHNNACEEASIIMAEFWLKKKQLNPHLAEQEILKMVRFQKRLFNGHFDLNINQTLELGKKFYHWQTAKILKNVSLDDLKKEIAQNKIIIAPFAGRLLKNPYFRGQGPYYHMLVIIGFDEEKKEFIVNDPGTKRGKNFPYSYKNLYQALHDWPGKNKDILKGEKNIIVISPLNL